MSESIAITGEANVNMASWLALRSALKLQVKTGMKMSRGRSASAIAIDRLRAEGIIPANKKPQPKACYVLVNKFITDALGPAFDKPLA